MTKTKEEIQEEIMNLELLKLEAKAIALNYEADRIQTELRRHNILSRFF